MTPVLVDTGFIVALLDRSERKHRHCAAVVREIRGSLVTCEAVIAESCYLLRKLEGAPEAVLGNIEAGVFQVPFRLDRASGQVRTLLAKYADVPMDLADACLVHLADELGTGRILTLDEDFSIYRWRKRRRFENLLAPGG